MKCERCGAEEKVFIVWKKGTKDENPRRRTALKFRDPHAVCERCLKFYPDYEVVSPGEGDKGDQ